MAGREIFIKHGFDVVDSAKSDFELLVKKYKKSAANPGFAINPIKQTKGLTIIRADQCPYTVKNVKEICETAEKDYGIKAKVIDLKSHKDAQNSPCPFGTFCVIYNGKIIAESPISKGRFVNIMNRM